MPKSTEKPEELLGSLRQGEATGAGRGRVITALLLCVAWIVLLRWHTYDEPLERDLTWYAVLGHEWLEGRPFYSDLWFHKPPAIKVAFAAAELLCGFGPAGIFLLNVVCALVTLAGVFVAARRLGGTAGAIAGAAAWAALSGDLLLEANQPNTEVFMNACVTWVFVFFQRRPLEDWRWYDIAVAGLLTATATLFKHIAVLPVLSLTAMSCLFVPNQAAARWRAFRTVSGAGGIIVAAWGAMLLEFSRDAEQFEAARIALFVYNSYYAGNLADTVWRGLQSFNLASLGVTVLPACVAWLLRRELTREQRRQWLLFAAGACGAYAAVVLPGRYFSHYFQLLLPWISIGVGGLIALLELVTTPRRSRFVVWGLILFPMLVYESWFLNDSPAEWSRRKYGNEFVETYALGKKLDRLLTPSETFYDFGQSTGLYYVTRRTPPTGLMLYDPLIEGPLQKELSEKVLADLQRTKPEILIVPRHSLHYLLRAAEYPSRELLEYLGRGYIPLDEPQSEFFLVLGRREGRLVLNRMHRRK